MAARARQASEWREGDALAALEADYGHRDFGVYARVIEGGDIALGQDWVLA